MLHVMSGPAAGTAEMPGPATDGVQRILEKTPQSLHERTTLLVGSRTEMAMLGEFLRGG